MKADGPPQSSSQMGRMWKSTKGWRCTGDAPDGPTWKDSKGKYGWDKLLDGVDGDGGE